MGVAVRDCYADIVVGVVLPESLISVSSAKRKSEEGPTEYEFSSFSLEPVARMLGE